MACKVNTSSNTKLMRKTKFTTEITTMAMYEGAQV